MRIVVESGTHLLNHGDNAMLVAAVGHLRRLWPDAHISVVTEAPERLATLLPDVAPLATSDRTLWQRHLFTRVRRRYAWTPGTRSIQAFARSLQTHLPRAAPWLMAGPATPQQTAAALQFGATIAEADLVLAAGGGCIADAFAGYAFNLLTTLHAACGAGVVTAATGQGIGPVEDPALTAYARRVVPRLHFLTVRDAASMATLESWGMPRERARLTGDDAIELGYNVRRRRLHDGIGVNVRVAAYSGIGADEYAQVRTALTHVVDHTQRSLVPLPTERGTDEAPIRELLDYDASFAGDVADLSSLLDRVTRCRVVVTCSYHAAVFALAQGIPAIGLSNAPYYRAKFDGLAGHFRSGCRVLDFADTDFTGTLERSIHEFWHGAESLRPELLERARTQITSVHDAYDHVARLVNARGPAVHTAT